MRKETDRHLIMAPSGTPRKLVIQWLRLIFKCCIKRGLFSKSSLMVAGCLFITCYKGKSRFAMASFTHKRVIRLGDIVSIQSEDVTRFKQVFVFYRMFGPMSSVLTQ